MEDGGSLLPVLLVVGLAFVVPLILQRFRRLQIPVVVGEIIAGMVIGRSGLNWVVDDPVLEVLAALGFAFLMFLSGLEIDFTVLAGLQRKSTRLMQNPVVVGTSILVLTIALAFGIAFTLSALGLVRNPWLPTLILSTTSLGIVLPVLREKGISSGQFGQTILLAALIADFVTMVLITLVVAVISGGVTLEVLLVGLLLVAFVVAARYAPQLVRWRPLQRALDDLTRATVQIKVRGALAVMFAFVVLSEVLGAEVILGAFLAGALISLISSPENPGDNEARHKLDAIGFGFMVPIFFIMVGVSFDLPALFSSASALALFPLLLVAAYVVKIVPALLLQPSFGRRNALAAGVLLSSRLSLIIAASAIGMRLGIISEALNADIILVAITTSTVSPALFNRMLPAPPLPERLPIVLVGAGQIAMLVAQRLRQRSHDIVVIDSHPDRVERANQLGMTGVLGQADTMAGLKAAGADTAQSVVVATADDDFNLRVCVLARSSFGIPHLVAYVHDPARLREFQVAGAHAVNPGLAAASVMDGLISFPDALELLTSLEDDKEVVEVELLNADCIGRSLRDVRLPGDVLVLSIRRREEVILPHGYNVMERGDHITLVGEQSAIAEAAAWMHGAPVEVQHSLDWRSEGH
ncbi:MAG: cation:proton antiporter [Anaerolineae bacterium]|nr:cation:proton antiporter [Anaerolineae bacterium]MCB9130022.1 cation:proton antiporter [Anaerolineales bacterium]MCB0228278.1 cation:proton antiporter [Anaerolineae bacterium]MCB0233257.1 cation:proton antiporter [Anaerolineae bacterium]MCB0244102.1 cation:proton antiporter [Anaerolineae bacterium]